jgi:hypothetical protein
MKYAKRIIAESRRKQDQALLTQAIESLALHLVRNELDCITFQVLENPKGFSERIVCLLYVPTIALAKVARMPQHKSRNYPDFTRWLRAREFPLAALAGQLR